MALEISGRPVGPICYGTMGLAMPWKKLPVTDAIATLKAAFTSGCNFWNLGEFYGTPAHNSLTIVNQYLNQYPEHANSILLSVKGCMKNGQPDGSPAFVKESVDNCLRMLGDKAKIRFFEIARIDQNVPLEVTLATLAKYVDEGKIGGVALSEVNANTIRKASKITKITAVEIELSLWTQEPLFNGITEVCAELNIPILAYSPLGKGLLTGKVDSVATAPEGDRRRQLPRFQPENMESNLKNVRALEEFAKSKNCTAGQLAINWVRCLSNRPGMPTIYPIPGSSSPERVKENALVVDLDESDMKAIDNIMKEYAVQGERHTAAGMKLNNR